MNQNLSVGRNSVLFITRAAAIAALYVILSEVSNLLGLCSGVIQCRLSEALTILPAFLPEAIPGLYIGCLLTNILTGCAAWDIVFGPVATLLGALGTYLIGRIVRSRALRSSDASAMKSVSVGDVVGVLTAMFAIPPIIANAAIIPPILRHAYGVEDAYWYLVLTVGAGEIIACGIFGGLLLAALMKNPAVLRGSALPELVPARRPE